ILSRLKESAKQGMDLVKKMKLYDGEDVDDFKPKDVEELKREVHDEGMSGIDPRYVVNRISSALVTREHDCIGPLDVLRALRSGLHQHPSFTYEDRKKIQNIIAIAGKEYHEMAKTEVPKAYVYSLEESARVLFD